MYRRKTNINAHMWQNEDGRVDGGGDRAPARIFTTPTCIFRLSGIRAEPRLCRARVARVTKAAVEAPPHSDARRNRVRIAGERAPGRNENMRAIPGKEYCSRNVPPPADSRTEITPVPHGVYLTSKNRRQPQNTGNRYQTGNNVWREKTSSIETLTTVRTPGLR